MSASHAFQSKYAKSWALVIGINKYKHVSPLGYATNDATAVAKLLREKFGFAAENVVELIDEKATIVAIRKSFMAFTDSERISADDRVLVFFAGPGHTVTGTRGEVGFLLPYDAKISDVNSFIRWDELTRNAELISAKHIFFIMDACYGGLALQRAPTFGNMRFVGDMLQRSARQVLTAGKANETVADGNGVRPGHSIFTAHLLNALEGKAATEEGIITASGVMAYVYDHVGRDQYSHQTPHYGFIEGDGDFIFDTSPLDKLRAAEASEGEPGRKGQTDILINTSAQIVTAATTETDVSNTTKELLSDPTKRIKLDDLVALHVRRFLDATDLRHFPVQGAQFSAEGFAKRLSEYEAASKDLLTIVILLARWGDVEQLLVLEKLFVRLAEADKGSSGLVVWINVGWYPIQLLMYAAGIAALSAQRYQALKVSLQTPVGLHGYANKKAPLVTAVLDKVADLHDVFKTLPGYERNFVPRSEYVFKALQPPLEDLLFLGKSYEDLFDEFELFLALSFMDANDGDWGPPGRFGWKNRHSAEDNPLEQLAQHAAAEGKDWGVLQAGLFQGSETRFQAVVGKLRELIRQLRWR